MNPSLSLTSSIQILGHSTSVTAVSTEQIITALRMRADNSESINDTKAYTDIVGNAETENDSNSGCCCCCR